MNNFLIFFSSLLTMKSDMEEICSWKTTPQGKDSCWSSSWIPGHTELHYTGLLCEGCQDGTREECEEVEAAEIKANGLITTQISHPWPHLRGGARRVRSELSLERRGRGNICVGKVVLVLHFFLTSQQYYLLALSSVNIPELILFMTVIDKWSLPVLNLTYKIFLMIPSVLLRMGRLDGYLEARQDQPTTLWYCLVFFCFTPRTSETAKISLSVFFSLNYIKQLYFFF